MGVKIPANFDFMNSPALGIHYHVDNGTVRTIAVIQNSQPWKETLLVESTQFAGYSGNEYKLYGYSFGEISVGKRHHLLCNNMILI